MNNIDKKALSAEELLQQNEQLQKENEKINKRLERVVQQGDRQHKQFEKLNEKLETYIDVIDDHVISISLDKDRNIITVSTAFSKVFGFKGKELLGSNYEILLHKDDYEKVDVELYDAVASKQPWHGEIRFKNKSDQLVWTNTIITPVYDEEKLSGFTLISEDVSKEKELKELKTKELSKKKYDQNMLEFMSSRSSAILQRTSNSFSYVIWIILATVLFGIIWANYAQLEELTRGTGKIIPSKQVQKIETFDNARVEQILVSEGDKVQKGQLLLKFNNIENSATLNQNSLKLEELQAKVKRLELESRLAPSNSAKILQNSSSPTMMNEWALYNSNLQQINLKTSAIGEKIEQKKSELDEAVKKKSQLEKNYRLLEREVKIKEAMAQEKIISEVEFIQLVRQKNDLAQEINQVKNVMMRARSSISELSQNRQEIELDFVNKARKEYQDVLSEIGKLSQEHHSLDDQMSRTQIFSPVSGTIKKIYVNTIGEVVQAGTALFEIVPSDEKMIAEVKIVPEEIAYLKIGQDAEMKFSAYDFNIYGGIKAKISYISADTILDPQDGKYYYIVRLTMDKDYLGSKEKPLYAKIGMVADVDIIHGKKSVMDYILKPILKAKQKALTEK